MSDPFCFATDGRIGVHPTERAGLVGNLAGDYQRAAYPSMRMR